MPQKKWKRRKSGASVVHACSASYSEDRYQEDHSSKLTWANISKKYPIPPKN
jgi:hypothetical protein